MVEGLEQRLLPAPVAVNDSYTAVRNITLSVPAMGVLGKDSGTGITVSAVNGNSANVGADTATTHGTTHFSRDGSFTYLANLDYSGTDSLTYTIKDATSAQATATVSLAINFTALIGGDLFVGGSSGTDSINVSLSSNHATITMGGFSFGNYSVASGHTVSVYGVGGADSITITGTGVNGVVSGGSGSDTLIGSTGIANSWSLTGSNSGNINAGAVQFTSIENLTGSSKLSFSLAAGTFGQVQAHRLAIGGATSGRAAAEWKRRKQAAGPALVRVAGSGRAVGGGDQCPDTRTWASRGKREKL